MSDENDQAAIIAHYDGEQRLYDRFWSKDAIHWGFWDEQTATLAEALRNSERFVARCLEINPQDRVLDAGSGTGGTALWMAREYGAHVTGINLCRTQVEIARQKARQCGLGEGRVEFEEGDLARTRFADGSFTKMYAIESVCYVRDKNAFATEAARLLEKGGRLAVVDAFLVRESLSPAEQRHLDQFLRGIAVPNFATLEAFEAALRSAGFTSVVFHDKLGQIWKSLKNVSVLVNLTAPFIWLLSLSRLLPRGAYRQTRVYAAQKRLYESQAATYGVFVAER